MNALPRIQPQSKLDPTHRSTGSTTISSSNPSLAQTIHPTSLKRSKKSFQRNSSSNKLSPSNAHSRKRTYDSISNPYPDEELIDHLHPNPTTSNHHHHLHPQPNHHAQLPSSLPPTEEDFPMIRCGWNDCRQGFWILEELIDHLVGQNGHVPPDPNAPRGQKCPCEWTGCPKQGKPQGSRMALLVHLRSHTGEKPFSCHKPECDKTFSRTDALAKHVRVSHGEILPSLRSSTLSTSKSSSLSNQPCQSGNKKMLVKAENDSEPDEDSNEALNPIELSMIVPNSTTTKPDSEELDLLDLINDSGKCFDDSIDSDLRTEDERRSLEQLKFRYPSAEADFLELVVLKAKFKFALGEREILKSELNLLKLKEEKVRKQKDAYLDEIMKHKIGEESYSLWRTTIDETEHLIQDPHPPAPSHPHPPQYLDYHPPYDS